MKTRVCEICQKEFPLTLDYFQYSDKKDGTFRRVCKDCYNAKRREKNRKLKEECPEIYQRRLDSNKRYYQKNKERCNAYMREWYRNHPDKAQEYFNKGRRRKMKEDPVYAWSYKARQAIRSAVLCKGVYDNRSNKFIVELTGLTTLELRNYLRNTFKEIYGYEWDEIEKTHVDHIIPLCTESTIEGKQKLCHYTNLRLIRAKDNKAKGIRSDYVINADVVLPDD